MSHTPGPWRFDRGGDERIVAELVTVALVTRGVDEECYDELKGPTFEANARLIAAAPDLLAALRDAVTALGGIRSDNVPESVRAAIAKAEGK